MIENLARTQIKTQNQAKSHEPDLGEPSKVQEFIKKAIESDGVIIPISGNFAFLDVRASCSYEGESGVHHCLTLLEHDVQSGQYIPFGWVGLRVWDDDQLMRAEFASTNLSAMSLDGYNILSPGVSICDTDDRCIEFVVSLQNGTQIIVNISNYIFHFSKILMIVDPKKQRGGWGGFLTQMVGQIAVGNGVKMLECYEGSSDVTIAKSSIGQSLYTRALGSEKIIYDRGWSIPLTPPLPTGMIERMLK